MIDLLLMKINNKTQLNNITNTQQQKNTNISTLTIIHTKLMCEGAYKTGAYKLILSDLKKKNLNLNWDSNLGPQDL